MRLLISLLLVSSLCSCAKLDSLIPDALKAKLGQNSSTESKQDFQGSKSLYVVYVHGEWCKTCTDKVDNPIRSLKNYFAQKKDVDYVVFDQTNSSRIFQSMENAKRLGLGNLFEHERHTGEVLFVDKNTKRVLTKVYGLASAQVYKDITEKLLQGQRVASILPARKNYDLSKPELEDAREADLLVIDIHHDLCGGCATTAPVFEEVARKYRRKDEVCFMTFDLTTPQTVDQTRNFARALGIENIYNSHKHTGKVLFVDAKNKRVLGSLVTETDKSKYHKLVKEYRKQVG